MLVRIITDIITTITFTLILLKFNVKKHSVYSPELEFVNYENLWELESFEST